MCSLPANQVNAAAAISTNRVLFSFEIRSQHLDRPNNQTTSGSSLMKSRGAEMTEVGQRNKNLESSRPADLIPPLVGKHKTFTSILKAFLISTLTTIYLTMVAYLRRESARVGYEDSWPRFLIYQFAFLGLYLCLAVFLAWCGVFGRPGGPQKGGEGHTYRAWRTYHDEEGNYGSGINASVQKLAR